MRSFSVLAAAALALSLGAAMPAAAQPPSAPPASSSIATMSAPQAMTANPRLAARIEPFLPGQADVTKAATGFHDVATFLATVHLAHNQQLSFQALKSQVMNGGPTTLVKAVQAVAPNLPPSLAQEAVQMAQHQAQLDLGAAEQAHALGR